MAERGALHLRGGAPPSAPAAQQSVPVFLMMPLDTISSTTGQVSVFSTSVVACVRDLMHHDAVARDGVRDGSRTCKSALFAKSALCKSALFAKSALVRELAHAQVHCKHSPRLYKKSASPDRLLSWSHTYLLHS